MSQATDFSIANQSFPSFRSDLNTVLGAINTSNSGTSRPASAVNGTFWLDTTTASAPILKFFDGTDDITFATFDTSANTVDVGAGAFDSGTSMLFQQTNAPTGWTKQTTHNDKAVRIVTGSVGTGGSVAFSTALGTGATVAGGSVSGSPDASSLSVSISGNIANTTLSTSQIPSHTHSIPLIHTPGIPASQVSGRQGNSTNPSATGSTGGDGSHTHNHNLSGSMSGNIGVGNLAVGASTASINVNYVDFIIANKD